MKIKRFTAKNMREAIRMVRDEQGPDAVILSNRRINGGIEVVAAVDYDEALMQASLRRLQGAPAAAGDDTAEPEAEAPAARQDAPPARFVAAAADADAKPAAAPRRFSDEDLDTNPNPPTPRDPLTLLLERFGDGLPAAAPARAAVARAVAPAVAVAAPIPAPMAAPTQILVAAPVAAPAAAAFGVQGNAALAAEPAPAAHAEILQLREELGGMRKMLEQRLATLAWNDLKHNRPQRYAVLKVLADLGLEPQLAQAIAEEVPDAATAERARFLPLGMLARRIPVAKADPILDGGVVALVGPTGVGKTTTIAKLAARYAEAHGLRDIALVAMDHYRIGAAEQLYTYARLLGVPVHVVTPQTSLRETLAKLSDRKLVLIDTVGMSPRDGGLAQQLEALHAAHPRLRAYLTIAANSQTLDQDEAVRRFGIGQLAGCILTKLDETCRIGGALSVSIRHRLPIAYLADGQRVPEDLHVAQADPLVIRAMQLARQTPVEIDDQTLALSFAGAFDTGAAAHG